MNSVSEHKNLTPGTFRELFYDLYPRLYSNCLKYVKDEFVAEEIVGDAMLALWGQRDRISEIRDVKSYLYIVVRNHALLYLRKNRPLHLLDTSGLEIEDQEPTPDIIEEEVHAKLMKAIDELPVKCREVFIKSCLHGISYKDIAEDLDISVNTVKSQRTRAIEILKVKLKDSPLLLFFLGEF
ncbi:RNA polymerase sigma-70 factor [Robertkochia solimangrovi]|uniref:RNA polymerase sigma-70 factor n=1 Tax=Robertkochia solimangrovi TaxID=2213046 RepID=UPI00117EAA99|nr:RNA polymerase sigma-70 factor [Robertkochia solimangrovi]TRZ43506.1 RNA polymerase sigma-70 factor [Robertkochia solimangrovi]